jgi:hypothetical protein
MGTHKTGSTCGFADNLATVIVTSIDMKTVVLRRSLRAPQDSIEII